MRLNIVSKPKMTMTKDKVASDDAVAEQVVLVRDGAIVHVPQVAARYKPSLVGPHARRAIHLKTALALDSTRRHRRYSWAPTKSLNEQMSAYGTFRT
jgi:hypothetical protein